MLTIPLYTFLFLYLIFLVFFVAFSIINFYHIVTTASFTLASFIITFFTFTLTVLTLYFTWQIVNVIDWQVDVILFNSEWLTGSVIF
ncbi:hypothetical protein KJ785_01000 [Patescibacteria group bacterium]|nr:hypothetical protein [Patescibacteria group bacterium]